MFVLTEQWKTRLFVACLTYLLVYLGSHNRVANKCIELSAALGFENTGNH